MNSRNTGNTPSRTSLSSGLNDHSSPASVEGVPWVCFADLEWLKRHQAHFTIVLTCKFCSRPSDWPVFVSKGHYTLCNKFLDNGIATSKALFQSTSLMQAKIFWLDQPCRSGTRSNTEYWSPRSILHFSTDHLTRYIARTISSPKSFAQNFRSLSMGN